MNFQARAENEQHLPAIAKELLHYFPDRRVFTFKAEMGTGKTTFIKQLCAQLGVEEQMSSPTFSIVNEYVTREGKSVYHFDFYRLRSSAEAFEAGLHELLHSGCYCFVEWPEIAPEILPPGTVEVEIVLEGNTRVFAVRNA